MSPPRASQRGSGPSAYARRIKWTCPPRAGQRGSGPWAYVSIIKGDVSPPLVDEEFDEEEEEGGAEHDGVYAVEEAAVAGQGLSRVFHAEAAF